METFISVVIILFGIFLLILTVMSLGFLIAYLRNDGHFKKLLAQVKSLNFLRTLGINVGLLFFMLSISLTILSRM